MYFFFQFLIGEWYAKIQQCHRSLLLGRRRWKVSWVPGGEKRGRFCSPSSLNLLQRPSCLQRNCVKQILSSVVEKRFQQGDKRFQGEPESDWMLRQVSYAEPGNLAGTQARTGGEIPAHPSRGRASGCAWHFALRVLLFQGRFLDLGAISENVPEVILSPWYAKTVRN